MKSKKFTLDDSHQKDINRSLSYLRKSDQFSDLKFVCCTHDKDGSLKTSTVQGHQEIFRQASPFMTKLIDLARAKQGFDHVWINLEDTEASVVNKLTECLYLGQTTANGTERKKLNQLIKSLGLKVELQPDKSSSSSGLSSNEDDVPATKISRSKPAGPKSAQVKAAAVSAAKEENSELKEKAAEDKGRIQLERLEGSTDTEVKKYYKKADSSTLAPNPFHKEAAASSSTVVSSSAKTQKRRLTDSDKKVVAKSSKKARQEDDSSSEDNSDHEAAKAARNLEIPSSAKAKANEPAKRLSISDSDNSEHSQAVKNSPKRKPGPKGRNKPKPAAKKVEDAKPTAEPNLGSIFTEGTDQICCCDSCGKIFVTKDAYKSHMANEHGNGGAKTPKDSSPERRIKDSSDEESRNKKDNIRNKKSAAKIREERKKSKRSSDSDSDTETVTKPVAKISKPGPKSKSGPGPKSATTIAVARSGTPKPSSSTPGPKSASTTPGPKSASATPGPKSASATPGPKSAITTPSLKSTTTPKSGPASKVRKSSVDEKKSRILSSSETSDEDKPSNSSPVVKKKTPTIKLNFSGSSSSKKKALSTPVSKGAYNCRFCDSGYDSQSNLKNHVLNHFKDELLKELPSCLPFLCPTCKKPSRDKITLLRHYAFSHRAVFKLCSESDFKARPPGDKIKSVSSTSGTSPTPAPDSSTKGTSALKKFRQSEAEKLLSTSDSDSDEPKRKPVKDDDVKENKEATPPDSPSTKDSNHEKKTTADPINFSSDDEGFTTAKKITDGAVQKSFDDLFNESKEEKEEANGTNNSE